MAAPTAIGSGLFGLVHGASGVRAQKEARDAERRAIQLDRIGRETRRRSYEKRLDSAIPTWVSEYENVEAPKGEAVSVLEAKVVEDPVPARKDVFSPVPEETKTPPEVAPGDTVGAGKVRSVSETAVTIDGKTETKKIAIVEGEDGALSSFVVGEPVPQTTPQTPESVAAQVPAAPVPETSGTDGIVGEDGKSPVGKVFRSMTREEIEAEESKVRDDAKQRLVAIGRKPEVADAEAAVYARGVRVAAERRNMSPLEWEKTRGPKVQKGTGEKDKGLMQPVNEEVDLESKMTGFVAQPRFTAESAQEVKKGKGRAEFERSLSGKYVNEDTGWSVNLSAGNVSHAIASAMDNGEVDFATSMNIIAELPKIIRHARLVETHEDQKRKENVEAIHRLFVPSKIGNKPNDMYKVKLTVKQHGDRFETSIEGIYRAYDARIIEKVSERRRRKGSEEQPLNGHTPGYFEIILGPFLEGVKDSKGNDYVPRRGDQGAATFDQVAYHGSPARFDRFDTDSIGSGEGANSPREWG